MRRYFTKQNRALLSELVRTDFKLRYQGSILGYAWSLLKPLLMFVVLYIVFVKFLRVGGSIEHYPIYLLTGIMLWTFFSEMTSMSLSSIVARGDLIQKIRIPRWLIVVASSLGALINLLLNGIVLIVFMALNGVGPSMRLVYLPLTLLEFYIFSLGVSLFLAAAYVKYRDITHIWEVFLQAGFYATPILYPLSILPNELFHKILILNPIAQITQDAKYQIVTENTLTAHKIFAGGYYMYLPFLIAAITVAIGVLYFRKQSKYFAENL